MTDPDSHADAPEAAETGRAAPGVAVPSDAEIPRVVTLAGRSMEPSLRMGWRLAVQPRLGPAPVGGVVLLATESGWVVHRLIRVFRVGPRYLALHRGDIGGRVGCCGLERVVGVVTDVLDPPAKAVPEPQDLVPAIRRSYRLSALGCALWAWSAQLAGAVGLQRNTLIRRWGHRVCRWL